MKQEEEVTMPVLVEIFCRDGKRPRWLSVEARRKALKNARGTGCSGV
ncbi:hypothetical protein KCP70_16400 [Salmonella enterica subsp. enterica]|nr:hypothetical protein KCP70_16400 [Salmonella enterica subsp. enterica]